MESKKKKSWSSNLNIGETDLAIKNITRDNKDAT